LSNYVGNPCSLGGTVFDNFAYSDNVDATNVNVDFRLVRAEFRLTDRITLQAGVAPKISPANDGIVGVKDQSNFSQGTVLQLQVVNSPGPAFIVVPGSETAGPAFFAPAASLTTDSTLTDPGGTGAADPGLSSFELGSIEADIVVPEPASFALIGGGLLCLGLLRRRTAA
jgi:hypothetical protein